MLVIFLYVFNHAIVLYHPLTAFFDYGSLLHSSLYHTYNALVTL